MRHVVQNGELAGWNYIDPRGKSNVLLPEQVIQLKLWNPYDPYRGLSELKPCRDAAESDYMAGKFNLNLMRNNGDQGAYVILKNGQLLNDDQRQQITNQLREKRELSQRGVFKPIFLGGDIDIKPPPVSSPDAAFRDNRIQNRYEIYIAFGVPPSMADKMESYSIGSASDWYQLIVETCIPAGNQICDAIDQVNFRLTKQAITSCFGWDEHPVMQAVRRERLDSMTKLWASGMPMKQINDYLSLGMPEYEGWDVGYLPFSVAPVSTVNEPEQDPAVSPAFAEPANDSTSDIEKMKRILNPVSRAKAALSCGCGGHLGEEVAKGRSKKELALWKSHMSQRRALVKMYESKFGRVLMTARSEMLAKCEKLAKSVTRAGVAADFMFDFDKFTGELLNTMRNVAKTGLQMSGEQLYSELGKDDAFKYPPEKVLHFLTLRDNKMKGVAKNVFTEINSTVEESLVKGDSISDMAKAIRAKFNDISRARATTIAMTETSAVYGQGRQDAMSEAGVQYKQWLTSGNANVRAAHEEANGQTVRIDEDFEVGGEKLSHPGDPNGSAENVINCHCVSIPKASADGEEIEPGELA